MRDGDGSPSRSCRLHSLLRSALLPALRRCGPRGGTVVVWARRSLSPSSPSVTVTESPPYLEADDRRSRRGFLRPSNRMTGPCGEPRSDLLSSALDGDGRDELAIDVSSGGATGLVEFYRVDPDGIRPLVIAEPGDPPYVEPGPAILGGGFDSGLQSPIECRVTAAGTRELVSIHAKNVGDSLFGPWKVQTTTMTLRDDRLVVTSTSDSERIYSRTSEVFTRSSKASARRSCGGDLAVRSLS